MLSPHLSFASWPGLVTPAFSNRKRGGEATDADEGPSNEEARYVRFYFSEDIYRKCSPLLAFIYGKVVYNLNCAYASDLNKNFATVLHQSMSNDKATPRMRQEYCRPGDLLRLSCSTRRSVLDNRREICSGSDAALVHRRENNTWANAVDLRAVEIVSWKRAVFRRCVPTLIPSPAYV